MLPVLVGGALVTAAIGDLAQGAASAPYFIQLWGSTGDNGIRQDSLGDPCRDLGTRPACVLCVLRTLGANFLAGTDQAFVPESRCL